MGNKEAVYKSIMDDPEEDLHRLVYADILEEEGNLDYAEYIRVEIELNKLNHWDNTKHPKLIEKRNHLTRKNPGWFKEIKINNFKRGFPYHHVISDTFINLEEHLKGFFRIIDEFPITSVKIHCVIDHKSLKKLYSNHRWSKIDHLVCRFYGIPNVSKIDNDFWIGKKKLELHVPSRGQMDFPEFDIDDFCKRLKKCGVEQLCLTGDYHFLNSRHRRLLREYQNHAKAYFELFDAEYKMF